MNPPEYLIGVDLGQANDYTAIAVLERQADPATPRQDTYQVRHLDRLPLGTPYPEQVQTVGTIVQRIQETQTEAARRTFYPDPPLKPRLIVDQTGVGRPVVDMLRHAKHQPLYAVTIHGGDTTTRDGYEIRVPKRELVSVLQVLLQTRRLTVASALTHAQTLTREMLAFKVTISAAGHDTYGNDWRENPHDDLVLAVALAAWAGERIPRSTMRTYPGLYR